MPRRPRRTRSALSLAGILVAVVLAFCGLALVGVVIAFVVAMNNYGSNK